jgi:hypothetical protein
MGKEKGAFENPILPQLRAGGLEGQVFPFAYRIEPDVGVAPLRKRQHSRSW